MARPDGLRWIEDNSFEPRYPFWTRANVSEVLPEPPSPLGWDLVWEGACVAGWRDLFIERCGMDESDVDTFRAQTIGIFGGYAYLGAQFFRVWASRTPGMEATTIDDVYFGDHPDVPPYVPEPWHENARTTKVMATWLEWATVGLNQDGFVVDFEQSLELRRNRLDHASMSDAELLEFAVGLRPLFRRMFDQHINQSLGASIGPGILGQICAAIGRPEIAMDLMTGMGGVDSASPAYSMWELSRTARASQVLTAMFEAGTSDLYLRLVQSIDPEIASFRERVSEFLAEFGSRGPNEWDLIARTWEINPAAPLAAIDRMRVAPDESAPRAANAVRESRRHTLEAEVRVALASDAEALGTFEVGLASAAAFLPGRERSKTSIIRVIHEARMALLALGERLAAAGRLSTPSDVFMFFTDELSGLVAGELDDGVQLARARREYRTLLEGFEPPFIINGEVPPVETWARRGEGNSTPVAVGDIITGVSGCPGVAIGRARVILDPTDPGALEPGEILVAPMTDPSWTPLFVPAAGVVVDVGAALSHAVIVSRELGIPCVPSALDATRRIPDGALVSVDGTAGTVRILELP